VVDGIIYKLFYSSTSLVFRASGVDFGLRVGVILSNHLSTSVQNVKISIFILNSCGRRQFEWDIIYMYKLDTTLRQSFESTILYTVCIVGWYLI